MKPKSIIQDKESYCYVCCKSGASDTHHVFNGAYRAKSEEDGMILYLHRCCHDWLHRHPVSNATMKARAQRIWMKYYGKTEDEFRKRYGKSYI